MSDTALPGPCLQTAGVVQPIGRLWLNALQMTVVPLVVALVVVGVNAASDAAASGRTAMSVVARQSRSSSSDPAS